MELWLALAAGWLALLGFFVWRRFASARLRRAPAFPWRPAPGADPGHWFGCLLSAHLAVLAHDDFNQFASGLRASRVRKTLAKHWKLHSGVACRRRIEAWLAALGRSLPEEDEAWTAWRTRRPVDTESFRALRAVCRFLDEEAGIVSPHRIRDLHLSMVAHDVQQIVYVTRLGLAIGFLSREMAQSTLACVERAARAHYQSWADYSLSAMLGMGVRGRFDGFDAGEWHRIARSHRLLLARPGSPMLRIAFATGALLPEPADAHDQRQAAELPSGPLTRPR